MMLLATAVAIIMAFDALMAHGARDAIGRGDGLVLLLLFMVFLYYTVGDRGFISCFDALSGEPHYLEERLPQGSTLKSSPVAAGDYLYVPTEAGDVHLVPLGTEYSVARTNSLSDQTFIASPAAAQGELYLRSLTHLFCIAED